MTVFRGYLWIIKRNLATILMYIGIFVGITIAIQNSMMESGIAVGFASTKLKVAVLDQDEGILAKTLMDMLGREQILVNLENDPQVIQEALYYGNVEYVLTIPEGAESKLLLEETVLESRSVPGSIAKYYVESQINVFLNQIRIYLSSGMELEAACEKALQINEISAEVTLLDVNGNAGERPIYNYYFGYMPYAFLGSTIMALSLVIMEFKKKEIRRRMESSAVSFRKQMGAMTAALLLVGAVIWTICMLLQTILYRGGIFTSQNVVYYLLNSAACILVALALGFFSGIIANGPVAINGINNVISLGLCFLGGIMVPLEMLGSGVKKMAQFLPTYWYSTINGLLGEFGTITAEIQQIIWKGLLVQFLFALAVFSVALVIRRLQMQEA